MTTDEDARSCGFADAEDMGAYVRVLREQDLHEEWLARGGPSELDLVEQVRQLAAGVVREPPLTVKGAAARLNVSQKTIRDRRLPHWAAASPQLAYRIGTGSARRGGSFRRP